MHIPVEFWLSMTIKIVLQTTLRIEITFCVSLMKGKVRTFLFILVGSSDGSEGGEQFYGVSGEYAEQLSCLSIDSTSN